MYADQETGLYYNMARYYDPRIGRYISSDPIGLAGGLNTYSYAYNNPLRYIDPSGLDAVFFFVRPTPIPRPLIPFEGETGPKYLARIQEFSRSQQEQYKTEARQPELPPKETFPERAELLKNIARILGPMVKYLRDANLLSAPPESCPVEHKSEPLTDKEWYQCYKMGLCI